MPALALSFLGTWQFNQNQTGGAPRAAVSSRDFSGGGSLTINMGSFSRRGEGTSTVTATRNFSVSSPREAVTIASQFQSILKNAGVDVSVDVRRVNGGGDVFGFSRFDRSVNSRPRFFDRSYSRTRTLASGTYRVTVTVRDTKERTGSWTTVSPYQFTFSGVGRGSPGDIEDAFLAHYRPQVNPFFVQPVSFD
jgi:hypothetical protein